jgi:hypothetical protein
MAPSPESAAVRLFKKLTDKLDKDRTCDGLIIVEGELLNSALQALRDMDYALASDHLNELELVERYKAIVCPAAKAIRKPIAGVL